MRPSDQCRAFAPGSIGNVACGFDVLGLALEGPGDEVLATRTETADVEIRSVTGDGGRLPKDAPNNTAGAAARAVLDRVGASFGVTLDLKKGLPLCAGMGGSASSAVAAAVAVNGLLEAPLSSEVVLECALAGEFLSSGETNADNAAPSLVGGMVLVPSWEPLRIIPLEVPEELFSVHVHPHMEIETAGARAALGDSVPLADAVAQWGNTAALVTGLFRSDWELIGKAVVDRVAEPIRARTIPGFSEVKRAAMDAGALAASLSGSGPSLFALCRGEDRAREVGEAMAHAFLVQGGLKSDTLVSTGRAPGARILSL